MDVACVNLFYFVLIAFCLYSGDCTTSRKVAGLIPDEVIRFFNLPTPTSGTMDLTSTQPLTEISTRNLPGRPAPKANNLTAICELIV
jgi:hypothetical protein